MRRRLRRLLLLAIGALYVASVPWYREPGAAPRLWLGMPDWVAVATLCYVAVAFANAAAWLLADLEDPPESAGEGVDRGAAAGARAGAGAGGGAPDPGEAAWPRRAGSPAAGPGEGGP